VEKTSTPSDLRAVTVYAAVADAVLILVFAATGRASHAEANPVAGVFATAWPFLAAAAIGWMAAKLWRGPLVLWPRAVPLWLITVIGGMVLRLVSGRTAEWPFVIVASIVLAVFLLGHRALASAILRRRNRNSDALR
jgi:hypothetical protein